MKLWQLLAIVSGSIIATVMALASISYSATLASSEPAFSWLPLSNSFVFAVLALAFDLGMIASLFGALHWWPDRRGGAIACLALFAIASLFSIHAVRGYIALNLTQSAAPVAQADDLYASLKLDLQQAQSHLGQLLFAYNGAKRQERRRLETAIITARRVVQDARTRLAHAKVATHVSPLDGLEWFLAITLWFFNATCWSAWFGNRRNGPRNRRAPVMSDTVARWLADRDTVTPEHCTALFDAYTEWCANNALAPLPTYSFYARLIELGARKYRNGRNGPTMYQLPDRVS